MLYISSMVQLYNMRAIYCNADLANDIMFSFYISDILHANIIRVHTENMGQIGNLGENIIKMK